MQIWRILCLWASLGRHGFAFVVSPITKWRLSMSLAVSKSPDTKQVIYQKVVRCPGNLPDTVFLGYLIEYLQDRFELPERLPMVYEKKPVESPQSILQIFSPLSSEKLDVSVVGIFSDDDATVPNMAMVAIQKNQADLPPMMANLFRDSEKKILKALELGLDEFSSGQIRSLGQSTRQTHAQGEAALMSELLDDDNQKPTTTSENTCGYIDAEIQSNGKSEEERKLKRRQRVTFEQRKAVLETMNKKPDTEPIGLDFAVMAAKRAQSKRHRSQNEFAVQAARKAVSRKQEKEKQQKVSPSDPNISKIEAADPTSVDLSAIRPPALDPNISGVKRSFITTISRPSDYKSKQQLQHKQKQKDETKDTVSSVTKTTDEPAKSTDVPAKILNLSVRENEREPEIGMPSENDKQIDEIIKGAQDVLSEMADRGRDMTPEEMLADVMKFGEEQDREKSAGSGFVNGAFEKAKEILREQRAKRDARRQSSNKESAQISRDVSFKELTPDEELRRMFEAGQRLADGRITTMQSPLEDQKVSSSDEELDRIVDSDKTVPRYGRVLDDELAELQVRINKSPGEVLDGPQKNPIFDVFSGPEVYNPNVDPETAVNWPGALPGTKQIRLPKELDEAVKQAKFAAEALMNVKEVEAADGSTTYSLGERDLTEKQVDNLRKVVEEAVQIGLIDDPLKIAEEVSRLQMLLDELQNQEDRLREIATNYADLLLSDNFVLLVKHRLNQMAERDLDALRRGDSSLEESHALERELLSELTLYAQLLLKEARALGAELESKQLELIRSICKVAMDPAHRTEEETAMALSDAVRDMRPLLDDSFVAYLKYAIAEEEGKLARAGVLDDPDHNKWLFVLKIVQQGVYAELAKGINRYLEHIWYILRMETPTQRRKLLEMLVDEMPTLDVRPFVRVVENIAGSLGDSVKGEFDGAVPLGEMTNKVLQLHRDVKEVLPPERIAKMSREADEWAAKQKERLMKQRNITTQRLEGEQNTEHLDSQIETMARLGDVDRFEF